MLNVEVKIWFHMARSDNSSDEGTNENLACLNLH